MSKQNSEDVTLLLGQAGDGDVSAKEQLFRIVQRELKMIAQKQMRNERDGHSLQATVLVDDAFLKLVGSDVELDFSDRKHFYRVSANVMRRILIDHERTRRAKRRGGGDHQRVAFDLDLIGEDEFNLDVLALDEALTKLAEVDPRQAEIVALHHFGGCSLAETAELLEISVTTVKMDWRMAKGWLHRELSG